jgi:Lon protease-like protein
VDLSVLSKYMLSPEDVREPVKDVQELLVIPAPNLVLLPGTVLPLHVVDIAHQKAVEEILATGHDGIISFAPLGRDREMMMSSVCGAGRLMLVDDYPDGRKNIIVEGDYRVEILEFVREEPFLTAKAKWLPDTPYRHLDRVDDIQRAFVQLVKQWLFLMGFSSLEYVSVLDLFKAPHHLADFIAGYFFPDYTLKQKLLETSDCELRVLLVEDILRKAVVWFGRNSLAGAASSGIAHSQMH